MDGEVHRVTQDLYAVLAGGDGLRSRDGLRRDDVGGANLGEDGLVLVDGPAAHDLALRPAELGGVSNKSQTRG